MKLNLALLFVAAQAAGVLSAAPPRVDHPLGRNFNPTKKSVEAQTCWKESPYGCTDGYCWQVCGEGGEWCWTAYDGGNGDWKTCSEFSDCIGGDLSACGQGDCDDCGCSC